MRVCLPTRESAYMGWLWLVSNFEKPLGIFPLKKMFMFNEFPIRTYDVNEFLLNIFHELYRK